MTNISNVIDFITSLDVKKSKREIQKLVQDKFELILDRSYLFNDKFSIRFCQTNVDSFNNVVIGFGKIIARDHLPFICCLKRSSKFDFYLINTSFISKVSQTSQSLDYGHIRGSILGSNIIKKIGVLENNPENFSELFLAHLENDSLETINHIIERTKEIATKEKLEFKYEQIQTIFLSVNTSISFVKSDHFKEHKEDLDNRLDKVKNYIFIASLIPNVIIRGRVIEYLIVAEDSVKKNEIFNQLKASLSISNFPSENKLGDYNKLYDEFDTATDIKTKVLWLGSNPKGFNVNKLLTYLGQENAVYLIYLVGITDNNQIYTKLISVFNSRIIQSSAIVYHWAGRGTRGVAQFNGKVLDDIIKEPITDDSIDEQMAKNWLKSLIDSTSE